MKIKHRMYHHGFVLYEVETTRSYSLYEKCFGIDHYSWAVVKNHKEIILETFERRLAEERLKECLNGMKK